LLTHWVKGIVVSCWLLAVSALYAGEPVTISILHTNDEHGWLSPGPASGGLVGIAARWKRDEGYPSPSTLALSSGDMWTGQALSSQFKGAPMVEAMSAMGYRASAVGNHEFDFGQNILARNRAASAFPYLSANLRGDAAFAAPYVVVEVAGVKVGIIGLTIRDMPSLTVTGNIKGLEFGAYEAAVWKAAAAARGEGAKTLVILAHVDSESVAKLAGKIQDLGIPLLFAGHDHREFSKQVGDSWVVESGCFAQAYSRVDLTVDSETGKTLGCKVKLVKNPGGGADPAVKAVVDKWRAKPEAVELERIIGYTRKGFAKPQPLHGMVARSWLWAFPEADVVFCNSGGVRQNIAPGPITVGEIFGVLPFDNTIYEVKLSGKQLLEDLELKGLFQAGVKRKGAGFVLVKSGKPIVPEGSYRVLVNSFMYLGGDGCPFKLQDPKGRDTGAQFRRPLLDWISALGGTAATPLEDVPAAAALLGDEKQHHR